jgi:hypothetical protein
MNQIYSKAATVVAYLGNEADESSKWIAMTRALLDNRSGLSSAMDHAMHSGWQSLNPDEQELLVSSHEGFENIHKAMTAFYSRDYWSRLWVVQECLLAHTLLIYAGGEGFVLSDAQGLGEIIRLSESHDARGGLRLMDARSRRLYSERKATALEMMDLFTVWGFQNCKDPRDRVFGLLGLTDGSEMWPTVDYALSSEEVYVSVVKKFAEAVRGVPYRLQWLVFIAEDLVNMLKVDNKHPLVLSAIEETQAILEANPRLSEENMFSLAEHPYI